MTCPVNLLLSCILNVTPGPALIRTVLSRLSCLPSYVFIRGRSFTSRKLYTCVEKFLCFLQLSDRAYVSGARCIDLFLL